MIHLYELAFLFDPYDVWNIWFGAEYSTKMVQMNNFLMSELG